MEVTSGSGADLGASSAPDTTAPSIVSIAPPNGATNVRVPLDIVVTFDEPIMFGTGQIVVMNADGSLFDSYWGQAGIYPSISGATLTVDTDSDFGYASSYRMRIEPDAIRDLAGNSYSGLADYHFSTEARLQYVSGNHFANVLIGGNGPDYMLGGDGNDSLTGGLGNDAISGGPGFDVAHFSGVREAFTVQAGSQPLTAVITGPEGTDILVSVERAFFYLDIAIAFDADGAGGQAYRLFGAALGREPDPAGLGYWISVLDSGKTLDDVASSLLESAEAAARFGEDPTAAQFVEALYASALHRAPDPSGSSYWLNALGGGLATREQVLVAFAESAECKAETIELIGNGIDYVVWHTPAG